MAACLLPFLPVVPNVQVVVGDDVDLLVGPPGRHGRRRDVGALVVVAVGVALLLERLGAVYVSKQALRATTKGSDSTTHPFAPPSLQDTTKEERPTDTSN